MVLMSVRLFIQSVGMICVLKIGRPGNRVAKCAAREDERVCAADETTDISKRKTNSARAQSLCFASYSSESSVKRQMIK